MNVNFFYIMALVTLVMFRLLVNEFHYDTWLAFLHYDHAAAFIASLRSNVRFQEFLGGFIFPAFVVMVLVFWMVQEDKSRIAMQFVLLPLAYIPFSIIGFTLVNAEFRMSYLYVNTLLILTCGYPYVLFWMGVTYILDKLAIVR